MVETWPHVQLFHGEGVVSTILVDTTKEERKCQRSKKRMKAEERRRRKNWKRRRRVKDKICAFHFFFILWKCVLGLLFQICGEEKIENAEEGVKIRFVLFISFLFCGLSVFWDCIFGFVVRMRDKRTKLNRENGTTLLLFLIFSSFGLTYETWP